MRDVDRCSHYSMRQERDVAMAYRLYSTFSLNHRGLRLSCLSAAVEPHKLHANHAAFYAAALPSVDTTDHSTPLNIRLISNYGQPNSTDLGLS
jgi:hypothetical protein